MVPKEPQASALYPVAATSFEPSDELAIACQWNNAHSNVLIGAEDRIQVRPPSVLVSKPEYPMTAASFRPSEEEASPSKFSDVTAYVHDRDSAALEESVAVPVYSTPPL